MKRKWIKRIGIALSIPILLFLLIIVLLYIPPVQNYLRKEVNFYASQATGMQIEIQRIDLRFPLNLLVRGIEVVQSADTLLTLESLNVSVKLIPLLKSNIQLNDLTLKNAKVNTAGLLNGMHLEGQLGRLSLSSDDINLSAETASITSLALYDTQLSLCLNDTTTAPPDSTNTPLNWVMLLKKLDAGNVSFSLQIPADTLHLEVRLGETTLRNIKADLGNQYYGLDRLFMDHSFISYTSDALPAQQAFDPSHISLNNVRLGVDSVMVHGKEMKALLRECSMTERCGFTVTSFSGQFKTDSSGIHLPELLFSTPYSKVMAQMKLPWSISVPSAEDINVYFSARLGKRDLSFFASGLPDSFWKDFPSEPFTLQAEANGNTQHLNLSYLKAELPSAFSLMGAGIVKDLPDSLRRTADVKLEMKTGNLNFVTSLLTSQADSSVVIPADINLSARIGMEGAAYNATVEATESRGSIVLESEVNSATNNYKAYLKVDSLQINHFMPKDSLGVLAITGQLEGQGFDFSSPRSFATASLILDKLEYGRYDLTGVNLTAELKNAWASAAFKSNNKLLTAQAQASYNVRNIGYTDAVVDIRVQDIDLYELGVVEQPFSKPVELNLQAAANRDSIRLSLTSGDLKMGFRSRSSIERLLRESTAFTNLLLQQIEAGLLNHVTLRKALPSAALQVKCGQDNVLARYLALNNITYNDVRVGFVATPRIGINGRAAIHALRMDTLQLDTVFFVTHQDTSKLRLKLGMDNGVGNSHGSFHSSVTGEVRSNDAELTLQFTNAQGETGLLLGVNARPEANGVHFSLTPEEPVVAFKRFQLKEHNRIFLQNDLRLTADVEMLDSEGMGLRVHSLPDSVNLQNLDIELRRIDLEAVSRILPYLPDVAGLFSLEANYQQTPEKKIQVAAEATIGRFFYNNTRIGNLGVGVTWLPDGNTQYIDTYLTNEGAEILTATGTYDMKSEALDVHALLKHLPLYVTNAFIPVEVLELSGDLDGSIAIQGTPDKPLVSGELEMHTVEVRSHIYGVHFKLDDRPLHIENSRVLFDKYAIYAANTTSNPFTVNGNVDFTNPAAAKANLELNARNYPLLNVRRSTISELYGRMYVDLSSTLKGPLNALVMRGNLNVLPNTNVTYVLKDSPLTVQDRLGELVEFASFAADTIPPSEEDNTLVSWGGLDMMITINIDPAVRMGVDLSADRSSYIALEGGGDLSLAYTPQGDVSLTGRYEFTGGTLKYALPVIPLKEFNIKSGSRVEWVGNPMNPNLNLQASERMRANVQEESGGSKSVNFDVSIIIKNNLEDLELAFELASPEDRNIQQNLDAMGSEERGKQAVALMVTGIYLAGGGNTGGGFNLGDAANSLLQNQLTKLAGSALNTVNISLGMENYDDGSGSSRTDYSFRYSQRFFNDRIQVVIGGRVSTGGDAAQRDESFIDNVSLEYRLDSSSTRYLRLFHNKNYESLLEGEITETGVGIVLRKKVNKLGELFIFKKKK